MKVLNFGSLNIDLVYGVSHHARTGETLTTRDFKRHMGGKGLNQSVALCRAGAEVYHAGCVGGDGVFLRDYLRDSGVNVDQVQVIDEATGHAVIQVNSEGDNCILLYPGANRCQTKESMEKALECFGEGDLLLMQNETNGLKEMMHAAREKGMRIALNPSPIDDTLLTLPMELVDYFILNEIEGAALSGETEPERIVEALLKKYPQAHIVLTLGGAGSLYARGDARIRQPIFKVKAVDTTGAGDTFTGYFLASQLRGEDAAQSLRMAAAAAAIEVTRPGAAQAIPALDEVNSWLATK
ncbi:MAG: ribokinase [Clostridia bacterium]|nr:ribokinase [Clostridia bacterium]